MTPTIGTAVQRGEFVQVYTPEGLLVCSIPAGHPQRGDGLVGFTSSTVSVKRDGIVYVYNSSGMLMWSR